MDVESFLIFLAFVFAYVVFNLLSSTFYYSYVVDSTPEKEFKRLVKDRYEGENYRRMKVIFIIYHLLLGFTLLFYDETRQTGNTDKDN